MEWFQINCDKCKFPNNLDAEQIDVDNHFIKNIIDSNYCTYFYHCEHKLRELKTYFTKIYVNYFIEKFTPCACTFNKNYLKLYNKFEIKYFGSFKLRFFLDNNFGKQKEINIEEFLITIKKGTIIEMSNLCKIQFLESILIEHNTGFTLKKIKNINRGLFTYIIDTPNYTKPTHCTNSLPTIEQQN